MGKISIILPDDLEEKLRNKAFELKEGKRGGISEIMTEALKLWLKNEDTWIKELLKRKV